MALQRQFRVVDLKLEEGVTMAPGTSIKVAFATNDLKEVNQHFGSSERFAIYALDGERASLLEVAEFGRLGEDGNENKLLEKFVVLDGCAAVYCQAVGGSAVRQLMQMGVQPLRVAEGTPIAVLLRQLQEEWLAGRSGWLARAVGALEKKGDRFDAMEAEEWSE